MSTYNDFVDEAQAAIDNSASKHAYPVVRAFFQGAYPGLINYAGHSWNMVISFHENLMDLFHQLYILREEIEFGNFDPFYDNKD